MFIYPLSSISPLICRWIGGQFSVLLPLYSIGDEWSPKSSTPPSRRYIMTAYSYKLTSFRGVLWYCMLDMKDKVGKHCPMLLHLLFWVVSWWRILLPNSSQYMFNNINILIVLVDISFFYGDNFQNRILKTKILFLQSNLTHQQVS